ncbi:MAG: hypothetical protein COV08_01335 [Candidatus Vogelbacteria bacterium CG10_big_fil_rev_8_21_14_0_10_49_38]|uniref:Fibronectin type-III domain-containing protein n=1 Tax=Candidatus Vogelbacteria bacterium CG10_big_fil_rev_8_21_14_0_10_49_38 TaxID=1975043 RepID=A0A2H0RJF5_9BACT|nr:MAG: hypothetical protein BK006_01355 [bacterium CG10_49_38]PIR46134.1 MAG: hypothetical protein COV08_01335 [Candidatus Vogelbacteria bacterium CG10_big_fil_rev_8_21_14_0_10_49_38]
MILKFNFLKLFLTLALMSLSLTGGVGAQTASSTSFQLEQGTLAPSGSSTSSSFRLDGVISQMSIGQSSAAGFKVNAGALYFPLMSSPVVSATAGDGQVALTWTPAEGVLGWTVSNYVVSQATVAGGPYSDASVGLVTNATRTGLTNDTTYYFVVRVKDAYGNLVASSAEVSATPAATATTPPAGGGGGTGVVPPGQTQATFRGRAYPLSDITLLKDGVVAAVTKAGPDANFEIVLTALSAGGFNFSVYATDASGNRSVAQTFPVTLTDGASILIGGIFIAPSLALDKQEVKKGDNLAIFGRAAPVAEVMIAVNSEHEIFAKTATDGDGAYLYNLNTVDLEFGDHAAKSRVIKATEVSPFGASVGFKVGTRNILALLPKVRPTVCPRKGDLNGDCRVNLIDFSIAAYWYKRPLTQAIIPAERAQLSSDGKIDLVDFSIMAYYWSG